MKILVTGAKGQLGHDVVKQARLRHHQVIETDVIRILDANYVKMDIVKESDVNHVITHFKPDAIIHCAAWTKVDDAQACPDLVDEINHLGTANIAKAAKEIDAKVVYLSTDYVFDGSGTTPWTPDEQNFSPLNVYGQTKLRGEFAIRQILDKYFIVRISWVFGKYGNNFVKTMLNLSKKYDSIKVVCDQVGTPTYTADLARLLLDVLETDKYGIYHATNEGGFISWYNFCEEIYKQKNIKTEIVPVSTREYGLSKALRPYNSRLDKSKLKEQGFKPLPDWIDALERYLKEEGL